METLVRPPIDDHTQSARSLARLYLFTVYYTAAGAPAAGRVQCPLSNMAGLKRRPAARWQCALMDGDRSTSAAAVICSIPTNGVLSVVVSRTVPVARLLVLSHALTLTCDVVADVTSRRRHT